MCSEVTRPKIVDQHQRVIFVENFNSAGKYL